jgi:hypothetical protein
MAENKKERIQRAEKARLAIAQARRAERRKGLAIWGTVVAIGVVLVAVAAIAIASSLRDRAEVEEAAAGEIEGVTTTTDLEADHVPGLPEPSATNGVRLPPAGGDHDAVPLDCGVYAEPVGTWNAVHSLEHGVVWVTYEPGLPADQVATLAGDAAGHTHVIVSPFPEQASPVVLTAWGLQLRVDSASDPRVRAFIAKYEKGPQTPEPGVPCAS